MTNQSVPANQKKEAPLHDHSVKPVAPSAHRKRSQSFAHTMQQARSHMRLPARIWSTTIHWRPIELLCTVFGSTFARPIALLTGSSLSLIATLGTYLIAKHYGYPLTGSEPLVAFVLGWVIGIIVDYTHLLITGGKR